MTSSAGLARFPDGTPLATSHPSPETLALLEQRKSAKWAQLKAPGPSPAELEHLLAIASRVPDHGKLAPWRFIVIEGRALAAFGDLIADVWRERAPAAAPPERLAVERARFADVPCVVGLVSRAAEHPKIPLWEQELSAGAAGMTLLIAACAMGYSAAWNTGWFAYDREVMNALGLGLHERIAGIFGLGTSGEAPERTRPELGDLVTRWTEKSLRHQSDKRS
jgi:nitroreductase